MNYRSMETARSWRQMSSCPLHPLYMYKNLVYLLTVRVELYSFNIYLLLSSFYGGGRAYARDDNTCTVAFIQGAKI